MAASSWMLGLSLLALALGDSGHVAAPTLLEVEPNAIQDSSRPMVIEVTGVPQGTVVRLQVLQDCYRDGEPDLQGEGECVSPLYERDSLKAGLDNVVRDRLDFAALEKAGRPLPAETVLWLRATRPGSPQALTVRFGLVKNPCTLWQSTVALFLGGRCAPGLLQALRKHRGAAEAGPPALFEVRVQDIRSGDTKADAVPGSLGATGVAWLDAETLVVTLGEGGGGRQPGVWRMPRQGGEPVLLWAKPANDPRQPVAPLRLPDRAVAFVRQTPGDQTVQGEGPGAVLSLVRAGKLDPQREIELPCKIHQLLASDAAGRSILALTLGAAANRPAFLQIDLEKRTVEWLGYDPALYQAAQRMPGGDGAVIAFEDNSGQNGWDLVLVDSQGTLRQMVQARPESDLLPAWRPDGHELAFLAEARTAGAAR